MRKRAREVYRRGDIILGWRGPVAVADYRDASGKRCRARLGELSEKDARAALDQFADARALVQAQTIKHTVGALWKLWMDDRAKDGLNNAIYNANWASLEPNFGTRVPDHITADDCRAYAQARFDLGRAPATVATELTRLRHCLKWAKRRRHISDEPYIWVPSRGKPRQTVVTMDEAIRLLQSASDHHVYLFILLAITTGARHRAILDLTWDRIDWDRGTIQYDEDEEINPMSRTWRKGRATVPMGARVRSELEWAKQGAQTDHVIEHGGRRLKSVREGFANAVGRAKLSDDVTPHTLRHSVATWLKERGVDLELRAQMLGHADTRTTDVVYSHADATYLAPAVEIINTDLAALPQRLPSGKIALRRQKAIENDRLNKLIFSLREKNIVDEPLLKRVLARCSKDEATGCLLWTGAKSAGYGRIKVSGQLALAHRAAAYAVGIIPALFDRTREVCVLHSCDTPACCNPQHLSAGSLNDNMEDCSYKGRASNGSHTTSNTSKPVSCISQQSDKN
jgi:integrase